MEKRVNYVHNVVKRRKKRTKRTALDTKWKQSYIDEQLTPIIQKIKEQKATFTEIESELKKIIQQINLARNGRHQSSEQKQLGFAESISAEDSERSLDYATFGEYIAVPL